MTTKKELINQYKDEQYLAIAAILKIALYEINFDENYVFGCTELQNGNKDYFMRHLEIDDHGYVYFSLHNMKHYRREFTFFKQPPIPPKNYPGKIKE